MQPSPALPPPPTQTSPSGGPGLPEIPFGAHVPPASHHLHHMLMAERTRLLHSAGAPSAFLNHLRNSEENSAGSAAASYAEDLQRKLAAGAPPIPQHFEGGAFSPHGKFLANFAKDSDENNRGKTLKNIRLTILGSRQQRQ